MTRSPARFVCAFCAAKRVTVAGIESHLRHRHPAEYRRATEDHTSVVFDVIP